MSKRKISSEDKISAVRKYLNGIDSQRNISKSFGVSLASFQQWLRNYISMGEQAFTMTSNKTYPVEMKLLAVKDYLSGIGSQQDICQKYGIRSKSKLQSWIKKYNGHEELKSSGTGGSLIMTKGRKSTFEERVDIVNYCIAHEHNYTKAAEKYQVSYQQARNYTIKYETHGIDGLQDRRGKQKLESEMSELERLRAENKLLKVQKEKAEMEASFLKKLGEIERRED